MIFKILVKRLIFMFQKLMEFLKVRDYENEMKDVENLSEEVVYQIQIRLELMD